MSLARATCADHIRRRFKEPVECHTYGVRSAQEAIPELDSIFACTLCIFEGTWTFTDERKLRTWVRTRP